MDALVDHVRSVAKTSSDSQRKEILNQLRTLAHSLETSDDTIQRLTFSWLELTVVRIGIDLKLFSHLIESASPLSVAQLSEKTDASPALLGMFAFSISRTKIN
jgi:demethylsterigmatocystin 6-O-methyltransferase